jgi:hypothetical protein
MLNKKSINSSVGSLSINILGENVFFDGGTVRQEFYPKYDKRSRIKWT